MSELNASNLRKEQGNEGPDLVGTTELTSPYYMVPPSGTTAERPQNPQPGTLRFNTDIGSLEYFKGESLCSLGWETINRYSSNLNGGARGICAFGRVGPASVNTIDYITISTLGNAADFGDRTVTTRRYGSASSSTRMCMGGGYDGSSDTDTIDYITMASTGNAIDFGNLLAVARTIAGLSNATRGIFGGNESPTQLNVIQYITIAQTGNAVDFGDTTRTGHQATTCSSSTRGLFAGVFGSPGNDNRIDYITIATTGNAVDFGDMTTTANARGGGSNATRGIFAGGYASPDVVNIIDYVTIATLGNAVDFGDMSTAANCPNGVPTSPTRIVFGGGYGVSPFPRINTIQYLEIMTTGNTVDFGDLTDGASYGAAGSCSNAHGGL